MSTEAADIIESVIASNYVAFATAAWFFYEYVITMEQEIKFIWKWRWTGMTALFMVNRYTALITAAIYAIPLINYQRSVRECCEVGIDVLVVTAMLQFLVVAAFSAVRVWLMSEKNKWFTSIVFLLNSLPLVVNICLDVTEKIVYIPGITCTTDFIQSPQLLTSFSNSLEFATRASVILADIIVVVCTSRYTYKEWREVGTKRGTDTSLWGLLLRDGSIYFVAMVIVNVVYIVESTVPFFAIHVPALAIVQNLPPILTARMILNLREAHDKRLNHAGDLANFSALNEGAGNDGRATEESASTSASPGDVIMIKEIQMLEEKHATLAFSLQPEPCQATNP
ncbi:hypothetical protein BDW22DRAFT_1427190 [Trametopsis cervina]|nr:hypothetical protein BDW22DRAFT_1427190 [Trametopsis cervina]